MDWKDAESHFLNHVLEDSGAKCSEEHKALYRARSPYRFYKMESQGNSCPCRVYGIAGRLQGTNAAEWRYAVAVFGDSPFLRKLKDGVSAEQLQEVEEWSQEDVELINTLPVGERVILLARDGWIRLCGRR